MKGRIPPRDGSNVVPLFPNRRSGPSAYDELTRALILKKFRDGTLPEGVLLTLLGASGVATGGDHE